MKNYSRSLFLWVFLALVVMLAFTMVGPDMGGKQEEIKFSEVVQHAKGLVNGAHHCKGVGLEARGLLPWAFVFELREKPKSLRMGGEQRFEERLACCLQPH